MNVSTYILSYSTLSKNDKLPANGHFFLDNIAGDPVPPSFFLCLM